MYQNVHQILDNDFQYDTSSFKFINFIHDKYRLYIEREFKTKNEVI